MNYPVVTLSNAYDKQIKRKALYLFGHQIHHELPKMPKVRKPTQVYFVLASDNLVKIGFSADVERRINSMRILHPHMKLIGTVKTKTEREVHKIFDSFRIPNSEWFHYDDSMEEFIKVQNEIE